MFLDAIGRTLRQAEEVAKEQQEARAAGQSFMPPSAVSSIARDPRRADVSARVDRAWCFVCVRLFKSAVS